MQLQQLHIDILTKDGISKEMYDAICKTIKEHNGTVTDDGEAPYTEDMRAYYSDQEINMFTEDFPIT